MAHEWYAALRSLAHRRGLAAAVIATLTLGIGANSAIFSAVDAVLLKPLPYPDADRLVSVYELNARRPGATQLVAPGRLEEWHRSNQSFTGLAGSYFENLTDTTGELPERLEAMRTSPRFFAVLGVAPAIGRTPTDAEERFGGPTIVVVSDAFWRSRLGASASAVGSRLVLGGMNRVVIGVMPASFRFPTATTQVWVPAQAGASLMQARQARFYASIGRLKPGVTIVQAERDLTAVQARLGDQYPDTDRGWAASLVPLKEEQVGGVRRSLWTLVAAVGLVLLAACGNVACLLLADAARREHEVAIRFALGADRRCVIAQLLREGLLLAMAGTALGLLAARWGVAALRASSNALSGAATLEVDMRLVGFTIALGLTTTLLFALVPALRATRRDPADALGRGGRGHIGGRHLLQRMLVGAQVALAIVLLVGAGLLIRSFVRLQQTPLGLDADRVLTFRMSAQWSERIDAVLQRHARTLSRLEATPGIVAAAMSQQMPAGIDYPPGEFHIVGRDTSELTFAHGRAISAGYFRTLGIPILQGTTCSADPTAPMATVVTRTFADRFFPGQDPIGHRIASGLPQGPAREIVGVVGDVRERGVFRETEPIIYTCGFFPYWPDPYFLVRLDPARPATVGAIRAAMREIEPARGVYAVRPLAESLTLALSQQRLSTLLLAVFAAMALLLAALGLYGVLSQVVAARRREIGVRMALGARPTQVVAAIVAQAAAVTGAGIAAGLAGAFALARFMTALVFGITTRDPLTFAMVPLLLGAVALMTALLPARRAARVDPMAALREE